jgi:hypothetical protein
VLRQSRPKISIRMAQRRQIETDNADEEIGQLKTTIKEVKRGARSQLIRKLRKAKLSRNFSPVANAAEANVCNCCQNCS